MLWFIVLGLGLVAGYQVGKQEGRSPWEKVALLLDKAGR